MTRITRILAVAIVLTMAAAATAQYDEFTHNFRMKIYVFEGSKEAGGKLDTIPDIVQRALAEVEKFRDYKSFILVDELNYIVRADMEINRFLDIPESLWMMSDDAQVSFTMIYDRKEKFLTLSDFRFMINQIPKIRNTVSVRPGSAVVIGSTQKIREFDNMFFILTLEVSDEPFPGQKDKMRFWLFNPKKEHEH